MLRTANVVTASVGAGVGTTLIEISHPAPTGCGAVIVIVGCPCIADLPALAAEEMHGLHPCCKQLAQQPAKPDKTMVLAMLRANPKCHLHYKHKVATRWNIFILCDDWLSGFLRHANTMLLSHPISSHKCMSIIVLCVVFNLRA